MKTPLFAILCAALFLAEAEAQVKIGAPAPEFSLSSVDGRTVRLSDYHGKIVVLEWINFGCPFVRNHYQSGAMPAFQAEMERHGIVWLTINSTHPQNPDYRPADQLAAQAKEMGLKSTALLLDPEGVVGHLYGAKTTPHMFVVDASGNVAYQGAIDDQPRTKGDPRTAKNHVRAAVEALRAGKAVAVPETKAYGCSVKYAK